MSDMPERIWVDGVFHAWERKPLPPAIGYYEYLRADLAPVIGYSREQMEDALRHFIGPFRSIDIEYYMNSLTPAAAPVIGYSREQVEDALCFGVRYGFKQTNFEPETTDEAWSEFEATLTPASSAPIPTAEEIADHIDVWFRTGEDKPWNFLVEDLAGSIHALLTKGRGGAV